MGEIYGGFITYAKQAVMLKKESPCTYYKISMWTFVFPVMAAFLWYGRCRAFYYGWRLKVSICLSITYDIMCNSRKSRPGKAEGLFGRWVKLQRTG